MGIVPTERGYITISELYAGKLFSNYVAALLHYIKNLCCVLFRFRLPPATKAPRGCPSPRRRAEENGKKEAETGGSG